MRAGRKGNLFFLKIIAKPAIKSSQVLRVPPRPPSLILGHVPGSHDLACYEILWGRFTEPLQSCCRGFEGLYIELNLQLTSITHHKLRHIVSSPPC